MDPNTATSTYAFVKDFVIPLVSPTLAAITLMLFVRNERKKLDIAAERKLADSAGAAYRDLSYFHAQYQVHALGLTQNVPADPKRIEVLQRTSKRIFDAFLGDPALYQRYFEGVTDPSWKNTIPYLLSEFEIHLASIDQRKSPDEFILFSVYYLLYLYEPDEAKAAEHLEIVNAIAARKPDFYGKFEVHRRPAKT